MNLAAPSRGLATAIVAVVAFAALVNLVIYVGLPILAGLLIFPALGLTGLALAGATALLMVAWWLLTAGIRAIVKAVRNR